MMKQPGNGGSGESHKPYVGKGEFLGHTKGNYDLEINRSYEAGGGSGESHAQNAGAGEFLGHTKGNYDLATDRSAGVKGGYGGGPLKAGGQNAGRKGSDGF